MPYDYIEEYQKQNDDTIWEFRDKDAQSKIDISSTETDYANPLTFETMQAQLAKNTKIKLEPIQDLHGYDKPWVGGAGKNLLPLTVEGIKSANSSATWTGNSCVINNVAFTILTDNDGNVTGIKANGTASSSANAQFWMCTPNSITTLTQELGALILNGAAEGATSGVYGLILNKNSTTYIGEYGSGLNISATDIINSIFISVDKGQTINNKIFYPMLRLSTETDSTFELYTNICPISGHDQIDILGVGKNILHINDGSYASGSVIVSNGLIKINGTFNSQTVNLANYVNRAELNKYIGKQLTFSKTDIKGNLEYNAPFFPGIGDWNYWHLNSNNKNTIIHNRKIDAFILYLNGTYDVEFYLQVEVNDDATEYEPYQESNDLTISFGQTVYGGQVDVENGVLTLTHNKVNMGNLSWVYHSASGQYSDFFDTYLPEDSIKGDSWAVADIKCAYYNCIMSKDIAKNGYDNGVMALAQDTKRFIVCDKRFTDATNLTNDLNGVILTYPLATPITLHLTPQQLYLLKAQNNLTTSQYTQVKVTYRNGVFATLEELSDLDTNVKDISDKFNALGLSVVDGKLCQTYNT